MFLVSPRAVEVPCSRLHRFVAGVAPRFAWLARQVCRLLADDGRCVMTGEVQRPPMSALHLPPHDERNAK